MIWRHLSAKTTEALHVIEESMNGAMYRDISEEKLISLVKKLNMGRQLKFQICSHNNLRNLPT